VAKLARDLAEALKEDICPYYPPVLEFFDKERALDIIRCLPEEIAAHLLAGTGYTLNNMDYERTEPPALEGPDQWEWLSFQG
jgi:hypothetical protein